MYAKYIFLVFEIIILLQHFSHFLPLSPLYTLPILSLKFMASFCINCVYKFLIVLPQPP